MLHRHPLRIFAAMTAGLLSAVLLLLFRVEPPATGHIDYSTEVVAADGEALRLYTTRAGYWRLPADSDTIDPRFIDMLLAYEDQRFFSHSGVDLAALVRALWQALSSGQIVSGASTLSMQTVRLLRPRPRTLVNKLREMAQALALERRLGKKAILDLYLSLAPYGGNLQGVRAASRFYFGKEPRFLTPAEAALLVALPQSPERRRPDRHPVAARAARDRVLQRLWKADVLKPEQLKHAVAQPVPRARLAAPELAPHLADRLRLEQPAVRQIRSTLDPALQRRLQTLAQRHQRGLGDGITLALLVLDNRDREPRAYLGSGGYFSTRFPGQVDMVRALRSPGSALKPFVYGMAFDAGFLHPETLVQDRPGGTAGYDPGNFDRRYEGELSVREALIRSRNLPAVRVLQRLGPRRLVDGLARAGVELRLPGNVARPGLPLALGGVGISLERLTGLYAGLAAGGGRAVSAAAAWYLTDILREAPLPAGFVPGATDIAFKTGTSYGFRDAWAIGYDAAHTVGVWVGRPDGGYTPGLSGLQAAVPLLLTVFDQLPRAGLAPLLAGAPDGVRQAGFGDLPRALQRLDAPPPAPSSLAAGPRILYPPQGAEVEVATGGELLLEIGGGAAPFHWLADGRYLGAGHDGRRLAWRPTAAGAVRLTVLDADGRSDSVRFRVIRSGVAATPAGAADRPTGTGPAPPG